MNISKQANRNESTNLEITKHHGKQEFLMFFIYNGYSNKDDVF